LIAATATMGGALLAALAALAVAYLNPSVTSLRTCHQQVDKLFDEALTNLSLVQAARHLATGVPAAMHGGTPDQQRDFEIRLRERGIERFDERMMNARHRWLR
jgi:hypothetical protein